MFVYSSSEKALIVAKRRLENEYSIVGINEDLPGFFQLLEWAFPSFFEGVTQIYLENGLIIYIFDTNISYISVRDNLYANKPYNFEIGGREPVGGLEHQELQHNALQIWWLNESQPKTVS